MPRLVLTVPWLVVAGRTVDHLPRRGDESEYLLSAQAPLGEAACGCFGTQRAILTEHRRRLCRRCRTARS